MLLLLSLSGIAGFFASVLSGLFGGGSGLITAPAFYALIAAHNPSGLHTMQMSIATGTLVSLPMGVIAIWRQLRYHNIDLALFKRCAPAMVLGAFVGALISGHVGSHAMKMFFSVMVFLIALWLMRFSIENGKVWRLPRMLHYVASFLVAAISVGIGVSVIIVPFFIKTGSDVRKAIGTATALVFTYCCSSALGWTLLGLRLHNPTHPPYTAGYFNLALAGGMLIPSILGTIVAVKLMNTFSPKLLKRLFIGLMLVVSVLMFVS